MTRRVHRLSARAVATLSKPGRHCDGGGLYLFISRDGDVLRRRWVLRFSWQRRVREMGLGSASTTTLAEARRKAVEARRLLEAGQNPIEGRKAATKTFGECATALIAAKQPEWRSAEHRRQWCVTLEVYCAPLWSRPVGEIDTAAVLDVLKPLWQAKPETATRLRGRIEAVLDAAKAQGFRQGENPARWRGHLDKLLPKRQKLMRGHHAAMPNIEVPAFLPELRKREGIGARALEFLVLTAARLGEVIGARWEEIDFDAKVWTIPASRTNAGREHRVPLAQPALKILKRLAEVKTSEFVFPGQKPGCPISGMLLWRTLRRMGIDCTVHGFRSSFRDWAGDKTNVPREIAEAALAHVAGDATERAYRRGDALEKRRGLMEAWAAFCDHKPADVVQLHAR